ncbi:hypothetical protein ACFXKF_36380 [Streptomyces scopuliridis]|uniref:hypothetical protein n=1 Tax=Streptomyces scopuliridis TaxID=452529 RepID=UPI0036AD4841
MSTLMLPARPATHTVELAAASIDGAGDFPYALSARARPASLRPESVSLRYASADGTRFDLISIAVLARFVRRDGTVNPRRAPYELWHFAAAGPVSWAPGWLSDLVAHRAGLRRPA